MRRHVYPLLDRGEAAIRDVEFTCRLRAFLREISGLLIFFCEVALTGFLLPRSALAESRPIPPRSAGTSSTTQSSLPESSGGLTTAPARGDIMRWSMPGHCGTAGSSTGRDDRTGERSSAVITSRAPTAPAGPSSSMSLHFRLGPNAEFPCAAVILPFGNMGTNGEEWQLAGPCRSLRSSGADRRWGGYPVRGH